ncbi:MAG: 4Fe-4S dicluster domain-containing protein [Clostridia bacterium]|nr:4Fe-4S dicluster domain-containing protein [Clostridia bacterium]
MSTPEQLLDNLATFDHHDPLNEKEQAVLEQARKVFMDKLGVPCSACRYCCDTCPAGLDIPMLIRGYNEQNTSGELWRLGSALTAAGNAADCIGCGLCAKKCPQKINIPEVMRSIRDLH